MRADRFLMHEHLLASAGDAFGDAPATGDAAEVHAAEAHTRGRKESKGLLQAKGEPRLSTGAVHTNPASPSTVPRQPEAKEQVSPSPAFPRPDAHLSQPLRAPPAARVRR